MTILEYYIEKSKDPNWKIKFQSTAGKNLGKTFLFMTTNYRSLSTFEGNFKNFLKYNNIKRDKWDKNPNHGQENAKHYVVNMRMSKLFRLHRDFYTLTEKGKSFGRMIERDFNKSEKFFLIYNYLTNSYFNLEPLYVYKRVKRYFDNLEDAGYDSNYIMAEMKNFLKKSIKTKQKLFSENIFWMVTFSGDHDFLDFYLNASNLEREELKNHVIEKFNNKSDEDLVAKKYKSKGQFTTVSFIDEVKVLYFTNYSKVLNPQSFFEHYNGLLEEYSTIYNVRKEKIFSFIENEEDVFKAIYNEIYGNIEMDLTQDYFNAYDGELNVRAKEKSSFTIEERIDETSANQAKQIVHVSSVLKRMSKERATYHCELEELHECRYFTSKENNENYLEIHHLIPREFANEFEKSIEVIDNYVALCPHCHRLLHYATDRERYAALNFLYRKRDNGLKGKGLELKINELKEYYSIKNK